METKNGFACMSFLLWFGEKPVWLNRTIPHINCTSFELVQPNRFGSGMIFWKNYGAVQMYPKKMIHKW